MNNISGAAAAYLRGGECEVVGDGVETGAQSTQPRVLQDVEFLLPLQ